MGCVCEITRLGRSSFVEALHFFEDQFESSHMIRFETELSQPFFVYAKLFFLGEMTSMSITCPSGLRIALTNITSATDASREHVQIEQCCPVSPSMQFCFQLAANVLGKFRRASNITDGACAACFCEVARLERSDVFFFFREPTQVPST